MIITSKNCIRCTKIVWFMRILLWVSCMSVSGKQGQNSHSGFSARFLSVLCLGNHFSVSLLLYIHSLLLHHLVNRVKFIVYEQGYYKPEFLLRGIALYFNYICMCNQQHSSCPHISHGHCFKVGLRQTIT